MKEEPKNHFFVPNASDSINGMEQSTMHYWKEENVFQRTISTRAEWTHFAFYDGPPFATGLPHYGHILAGTIKDTIPRWKTMQGYRVPRRFGWDCHGVPVEFQVEKEHKIGGKPGIEAMGVKAFNELCQSIVLRCRDDWEDTVHRMGRFVDFDNDYRTMDADYMESVWWIFGQLWQRGLIYAGEKVVAYSPKLGSPLSNFEANLNYKDIDDPAVTVRFPLADGTIALAWTTTPWTLPANCALTFGRDMKYALVDYENEQFWVHESKVESTFGEGAKVIKNWLGIDFLDMKYTPLFDFFANVPNGEKRFVCLHDDGDYVSAESGTGIVHCAPSFGAEDAQFGHAHGVKGVNPIDENGYFDESVPPLQGHYFRKDSEVNGSEVNANDWVLGALKDRGKLFKREQIRHSYPHCWRTDCALMYRGIHTWFVDVQKLKRQMVDCNQNINWVPNHLRDGRFGKGLEGAPDWAISRNRYWGAPMPVWENDQTGERVVISSKAELEAKCGQKVEDLHRQHIDDLTWEGAEGGTFRRIEEVLDCWFESGSMPYASQHYPFESNAKLPFTRAILAHGLGGTPSSNWLPWLKRALEKRGVEVHVPGLPDPETPNLATWAQAIIDLEIDKNTVLVGHSLGAAAVVKALEHSEKSAHAAYLAAPAVSKNIGKPYAERVSSILQSTPLDWSAAVEKAKNWVVFQSSNDPYVPAINAALVAEKTGAEVVSVEAAGHFSDSDGYAVFQQLFDHIVGAHNLDGFAPSDFIAEGLDQTRCWFYNLHVLGCALTGENVYKNVITNGIVLAEDGQKMSKSKQNYPDPNIVFEKYGADAVRWYLMNSPVVKGENMRFSERGVEEVVKSLILPLTNAYKFMATYANIDGWKPTKIIAVRHGEGTHNVAGVYSGQIDSPHELTKKGKAEVAARAKTLPKPDIIIASPLLRTRQTAQIIADGVGYTDEIIIDDRFKEPNFGDLEGKKLVGFLAREGNKTTEKQAEVLARVEEFWREVSEKYQGKTVIVVGHGESLRAIKSVASRFAESTRLAYEPTAGRVDVFAPPVKMTDLDDWIIGELQTLIAHVSEKMEAYQIDEALRPVQAFIDGLTNWYIRRNRRRFWASGLTADKHAAYSTLHHCLTTLSKLLAPVMPFLAERLWGWCGGEDSVHLQLLPQADHDLVQPTLQKQINTEREIVRLAAATRSRIGIKLRQPLGTLRFALADESLKLDTQVIAAEANVKQVEQLKNTDGIAEKVMQIDARKVGKKFGKKTQELIVAGKNGDYEMLSDGAIMVVGERIEPDEYTVRYNTDDGMEADSSAVGVVVLDGQLTPELEKEGIARDAIRLLQDARKAYGFAVSDFISVSWCSENEMVAAALNEHQKTISTEVLANVFTMKKTTENQSDLAGGSLYFELKKDD